MYKAFLNIKGQLLSTNYAVFEIEGKKIVLDASQDHVWTLSVYFSHVCSPKLSLLGFNLSSMMLQSCGCFLRRDAQTQAVFLEQQIHRFSTFIEFRKELKAFLSHTKAWEEILEEVSLEETINI